MKTPGNLGTSALHAMRRRAYGETVDCTRWSYGAMAKTRRELIDGGWMTIRTTPKGTKHYLELTDKGKALLPEIARFYDERQHEQANYIREQDILNRRQRAGPKLAEALHNIMHQTHDEDTRRYAREVLTEIGDM